MITRTQIIQVLEGALNALENQEATDHNAALHRVLLRLSADLALLERGEVPPLFVPKKVKARGKRPGTVRELRLKAIAAVKRLRKFGYSAESAIEIVAGAYGRSPEAIRQWRKTLGKDTDPEAQMLMASYTIHPSTKEGLLKAIAWAGKAFKHALKGK
jgi:hypothetical protein